ncbi:MAG: DUF371 domain-containing protein [Thermofilum sp.]|jgi:hypothetical protein|nr:DUF371 domain-containing protein [Thermofilum sp.]MCC6059051.1 DUF371 domain-containing protein [Thermofilum sp.]
MPGGIIVDVLQAQGHPNVKALHRTTLEITKDDYVTPRGDCIIAVKANKAAADLQDELKRAILSGSYVTLILTLHPYNLVEVVRGVGAPTLTLEDPRSIVVRKSSFTDPRTIAIRSNKAAADLDRNFVNHLKNSNSKLKVLIIAHSTPDIPLEAMKKLKTLLNNTHKD